MERSAWSSSAEATAMEVQETQKSTVQLIPHQQEEQDGSRESSWTCAALAVLLWTAAAVAFGCCIWLVVTHVERTVPGEERSPDHDRTLPYERTNQTTTKASTTPVNGTVVCDTADCHLVRFLLTLVDESRDPCENFYSYVCHKMSQKYPWWFLPKRVERIESATDFSHMVSYNVTEETLQYLYNTATPRRNQRRSQKPSAFFQHCLFEGSMEENREVMLEFLRQRGLVFEAPTFDPLDMMAQLLFQTRMPSLFFIFNVYYHIYAKEPWFVRAAFQEDKSTRVADDLSVLEIPSGRVGDFAKDIRTTIAVLKNYTIDENRKEHKVSLSQLGFLTNDTWLGNRWAEVFRTHTQGRVPWNARVRVMDDDIRIFLDLFGQHSKFKRSSLRLYMSWRTLSSLLDKIRDGSSVRNCWHVTLGTFGYATSADVLFRTVNQSRVEAMQEMFRSISQEVRRSFGECEWIDDSTRKAAQEKIDLIKVHFATDRNQGWRGGDDMKYFPDFDGPFLSDVLKADSARTTSALRNVFDPSGRKTITSSGIVDRVGLMDPNAYYVFAENSITVHPTITLSPKFAYGGPPSVNYGALGAVLTHEIMHGYNEHGLNYDGHGKRVKWWSEESERNYRHLLACYNETIEKAPKERGLEQLAPDYLADTMGQESLYKAYKKATEMSPVTLGDVGGLTEDQVFFVSWCFTWCGVDVPDSPSSHPPDDERCNVPLMNSVHFSEAFSCPAESPMNPTKKCRFW